MKKKILILMLGIMLIGINVYAQGNLQVNGLLGVGTSPSTDYKASIHSNGITALDALNEDMIAGAHAARLGANFTNRHTPAAGNINLGNYVAAQYTLDLRGSGQVANSGGQLNIVILGDDGASGYNLANVTGAMNSYQIFSTNGITHTIDDLIGVWNRGIGINSSGNYNVTRAIQFSIEDFASSFTSGQRTKWNVGTAAGLWIDKQTIGDTNNYGIVLNGDGVGADIVFGASQQASIYSSAGLLYAKDMNGNITQFSPHDPETGEWIYYSRNTRTGVTKKVNMEKLVKAIEKLTGETFMIETLTEDK